MQYTTPRGAAWLAEAFHFYGQLIVRAYNALASRLDQVYDKLFPTVDPRIVEANRLRRAADRIRIYHPSVAQELYAAADRHERND